MPKRYQILFFIWLLQFINYMDRLNISVAGPTMMKSLSIDPGSFGLILAAFTCGYAIMQIPGGILADKYGAKILLVITPVVWSIFTGMTGLVHSVEMLIVVRFCFGICEGLSNASFYKTMGDNFPSQERAKAAGLWNTAPALGPALVAPLAVWILLRTGWQNLFLVFAIPGIVMSVVLWFVLPNNKDAAKISDSLEIRERVGWTELLVRPSTMLLAMAYMTFNVGYWGLLGWMPSYLSIARHIDLKTLGYAASIPYLGGFFGLIVYGWLGSSVFYRYRAQLAGSAYFFAAVSLYVVYTGNTVLTCMIGLCFAAFFLYGGFAPYGSIVLDLAPVRNRGSFFGFISTCGQVGGFVAPIIVGAVVKRTGSFNNGFIFMITSLFISTICYLCLARYIEDGAPKLAAV